MRKATIYRDAAGDWRWYLRGDGNEKVAYCAASLPTKEDALAIVDALFGVVPVRVVDVFDRFDLSHEFAP